MTDTDIIETAQLRLNQLKRDIDLQFGQFEVAVGSNVGTATVHAGKIKHIDMPFPQLGCVKKITVKEG